MAGLQATVLDSKCLDYIMVSEPSEEGFQTTGTCSFELFGNVMVQISTQFYVKVHQCILVSVRVAPAELVAPK